MHPEQPDLLFLLHNLARMLRTEADKRARGHGMTRAQWAILFWLQRQPALSQRELATILEVEPITVARLIDRLEARGMVERRPDAHDRRVWRLHLQPAAFPILAELEGERAQMLAQVTAGLSPEAIATAAGALLHMRTALGGTCSAPVCPAEASPEPGHTTPETV